MAENINNHGPENTGQNPPQNPDEFPLGNPHDPRFDQAPIDPATPVDPNAPPAAPFEAPLPGDATTPDTPNNPEDPNWVIADPNTPQDNANMPPVEGFPHGNPDDPTVEDTAVNPDVPEGPEGPVDPNAPNDGQNDANGNNRGRFARFRRDRGDRGDEDTNQPTDDPNDPAVVARHVAQNTAAAVERQDQVDHRQAREDVDTTLEALSMVDRPDQSYTLEYIEKIPWTQQRILESKFMQPGRLGRRLFPNAGQDAFGLLEYQAGEVSQDRRHQRYRVARQMEGWLLPDVVRPRNDPTNGVATARSTSLPEPYRVDTLAIAKDGSESFTGTLRAHVDEGNESQRQRTVAVGEDLDVLGIPASHQNDGAGRITRMFRKDHMTHSDALETFAGADRRVNIPQDLTGQTGKLRKIENRLRTIRANGRPDSNPDSEDLMYQVEGSNQQITPRLQPNMHRKAKGKAPEPQYDGAWWDEHNAHAENDARNQHEAAKAAEAEQKRQEQLREVQHASMQGAIIGNAVTDAIRAQQQATAAAEQSADKPDKDTEN